ncbi:DNA polymerase III subunit gamma/tau [Candidatus Saccharibacteria bacterium]|nr:DNA polymerase III subunit gamma/tau [Candidatus Saccharibacteria bacterium]
MLALYRKYRPKSLADVVGQDQVVAPLASAIKSGKISHSYLFTGPRGTGKTSVARILAHEINGFKYELEDSYLDIIEIDAASNTGVDNIRDLREKALIAPSEGNYKVYIIDEVHMLSKSAFNALLKTLEEPPKHVVFILATTDLEKVPITIISRSQVYTFRLASSDTLLPYLKTLCEKEKINITDNALKVLISRGGGSFRDTLSLLDQVSTLSTDDKPLTEELLASVLGLPLEKKLTDLLTAYVSGDFNAIASQLKNLLNEGLKPESIATSALNRICSSPTPTFLPLLKSLPAVSAPFADAKLLLAFTENISQVSKSIHFQAGEPNVLSSEDPEPRRGLARDARDDGTARRASDKESFGVIAPENESSSGREENRSELEDSVARPTSLSPALKTQLSKCKLTDDGEMIHIYPSAKITKLILEKPANASALRDFFTKSYFIHDVGDVASDPSLSKISDIMGKNIQEVNENGAIPF